MGTSHTENLIEAALERQAAAAPASEPVAARLPVLRLRRRRRMTGLAAVAVVGALAVPTSVRAFSTSAEPASPSGPIVESTVAEPPGPPSTPLRYTVTWLPDDFVEVFRSADVEGEYPQTRIWAPLDAIERQAPNELTENVVVFTAHDPDEIDWDTVAEDLAASTDPTVDGSPAMLFPRDIDHRLTWMPDDSTVLTVRVGNVLGSDTGELAYQVAESVRPDGESPVRGALEAGWLPPSMAVAHSGVMRVGDGWGAVLTVGPRDADVAVSGPRLHAQVGEAPSRLPEHGPGTPVQVGDREGTFWPARDTGEGPLSAVVQVELADGRWLETTLQDHEPTELGQEIGGQESMVRFAEGLIVLEEPAGGWFGD
ncbi:hypothetical protein FHR81_002965 [Actinoalloteichus hoggarensis]|nr:hypothetical protein [Actinoalloteichus hoggarensis]MBB5921925.1 hypothetical protein [Actinoalloteichus hoggarensis]